MQTNTHTGPLTHSLIGRWHPHKYTHPPTKVNFDAIENRIQSNHIDKPSRRFDFQGSLSFSIPAKVHPPHFNLPYHSSHIHPFVRPSIKLRQGHIAEP